MQPHSSDATTCREVLRKIEWIANEGNLTADDAVEQIAGLATGYRLAIGDWDAEPEGNKLLLLFQGYLYGDEAVTEGMVVAAIQRFRTRQEIELNPDWQADRGRIPARRRGLASAHERTVAMDRARWNGACSVTPRENAESSERGAEGAHPISGQHEPDAPLRNAAGNQVASQTEAVVRDTATSVAGNEPERESHASTQGEPELTSAGTSADGAGVPPENGSHLFAAFVPGDREIASRLWGILMGRMTPLQIRVLHRVAQSHPTSSELAMALDISPQHAGNLAAALHREGLLYRERSSGRQYRWFPAFPAPLSYHYFDRTPITVEGEAAERAVAILTRRGKL